MKLAARIGQLIVGGFEGEKVPRDFSKLVSDGGVGGVILFRSNLQDPEQIACLTNELQRLSSLASLLIMVDQEGGRVSRLPAPFTRFPPASVLGKCGSVPLAYQVGRALARELRAVGINMDLAPVLDVLSNSRNTVIADRAFGKRATEVARLGTALMRGLEDGGVIPCGKHFPGHGSTVLDSHLELPVVSHSIRRLLQIDCLPFRHVIAQDIPCLMTAHVVYTELDARYPATLSKAVVTRLLRRRLGFEGVVLSDDLFMAAIADRYDLVEAATLAIRAGVDLLLVCREPDRQQICREGLLRAVRRGVISETRINRSVDRVMRLKSRWLDGDRAVPLKKSGLRAPWPEHLALVRRIRKRASHAVQG